MKLYKNIIVIFIMISIILSLTCCKKRDEIPPIPASEYYRTEESLDEEQSRQDILPTWQFELPAGMIIPDESRADLPELTHFDYRFYRDDSKVYNEKQEEYIKESWQGEYVGVSSGNSSVELKCYFHIINQEGTHAQLSIYIAQRVADSNLYLGDIISSDEKSIIGKFLVAYQEEQLQISISYFTDIIIDAGKVYKDVDEAYKMEEGLHYYHYYLTKSEILKEKELGASADVTDFSTYSGTWYRFNPYHPDRIDDESYLTIDITEDGIITGYLQEMGYYELYAAADISGYVVDNVGEAYYSEDGFGHTGRITIYFYEHGLQLYINEQGEPNLSNGFFTGYNSYIKQ